MLFKAATTLFALLVAATALPYREWERAWVGQIAGHTMAARTQAKVEESACVAVTETRGENDYTVRVCKADKGG